MLVLPTILLVGCAAEVAPVDTPTPVAPPAPTKYAVSPTSPTLSIPVPEVTVVPVEPSPSPPRGLTSEVPVGLLTAIKADLAARLGVEPEAIAVIKGEAVIWSDGSLGCPKPGEFYPQVLVEGYHIILRATSKDYDYRASRQGYFRLCEQELIGPEPVEPIQL